MVIGNPLNFSIIIKAIKEWKNDNTNFFNGILMFSLNGVIIPNEIVVATLSREVWLLRDQLSHIGEQKDLFRLPKEMAFIEIYRLLHSGDAEWQDSQRFDLTPDSLADQNYYVYAVKDGEMIRILASNKLPYDKEQGQPNFETLQVQDVYISEKEIMEYREKMAGDLISFLSSTLD